ncbi:carbohydrate ABC transporter permease, partial [Streptomyces sp. NPDC057565]|uniref:carbohydrate ABC transporter permease n=1 Tax=Streptomyces sp. NPDC057565 TaxID=3346169 RepID=UPI00367EB521
MNSRVPWVRPLLATGVAAIFCLPLYVALVNAFKTSAKVVASPLALPVPPTLDNIVQVLQRPDGLFWYGLVNSVILTAFSILITTVLAAMSAYHLVRSGRWWSRAVLGVMLTGLMIPPAVIMLPITRILNAIGLLHTMPGAVLVNVGYYLPFAVLVFMGFIRSIPR